MQLQLKAEGWGDEIRMSGYKMQMEKVKVEEEERKILKKNQHHDIL